MMEEPNEIYIYIYIYIYIHTELFKMNVGVLTTFHTQCTEIGVYSCTDGSRNSQFSFMMCGVQ